MQKLAKNDYKKKVKRILLLLITSVILIGCLENNFSNTKIIKLSDGKKIEINLEEKEIRKNEKIILVDYQIEERVLKEETVEKQILEIWDKLKKYADERKIRETLITAKYFIGNNEKNGEAKYQNFLFEAEKIENETWQIKKVN